MVAGFLTMSVCVGLVDQDTLGLIGDMDPEDDSARTVRSAARCMNRLGFDYETIPSLYFHVWLALFDMDRRARDDIHEFLAGVIVARHRGASRYHDIGNDHFISIDT